MNLFRPLLAPLVVSAALSAPAFAALGGDAASVEADRATLKGALVVTSRSGVTVHEIKSSTGTRLREYLGADGRVFAVSWQGPAMPDLRQLLGSYSQQLEGAAGGPRYNHHHFAVRTADVVVESNAHLRSFYGRAWVPALLPQSFSAAAIN